MLGYCSQQTCTYSRDVAEITHLIGCDFCTWTADLIFNEPSIKINSRYYINQHFLPSICATGGEFLCFIRITYLLMRLCITDVATQFLSRLRGIVGVTDLDSCWQLAFSSKFLNFGIS